MTILLIEDEARVASFIQSGLAEEGIEVHWEQRGESGLEYALGSAPDLVLLDIRLPDMSGIEVCRRLRLYDPEIPILMLTALDSVEDRVTGLDAGADDYLPKPFAFAELLARIRALTRRRRTTEPVQQPFEDGPLVLDPRTRTSMYNGEPFDLTQKEFDLLAYFLTRKNEVLSREEIHRDVWGAHFDRGTNLIDVYVGYVRRKLSKIRCPSRILSVRGIGYKYEPHDTTES